MSALAPTLQSFFTSYLVSQRAASDHTITSYRDSLRPLLTYVHERTGIQPSDLDISVLDAELIAAFLTMLEKQRGNSTRTRNTRLAAIHSLYRHAALRHPEHAELIARVLAIPTKNHTQTTLTYLTTTEIDALLASPPRTTWTGRRDHLLILLMITTGVRVSELTALARSERPHRQARRPHRQPRQGPKDQDHAARHHHDHRDPRMAYREPRTSSHARVHRTRDQQKDDNRRRRATTHPPRRYRSQHLPNAHLQEPDPAHPAPHLRDAHARLRD